METLIEYANTTHLTRLLIKERAKYRRRNRNDKHHTLDKDCPIEELTNRKMLSRLMPPRYTWVRPRKSKKETLTNGMTDTSRKKAEKALLQTIKRDRARQQRGEHFSYLDELDAFILKIQERLKDDTLAFESPQLVPILKDAKHQPDGTLKVTCRPLSIYTKLEDKIILGVTSHYLTKHFDWCLHKNILSYRKVQNPEGEERHMPDFNDGMRLIKQYLHAHPLDNIYAADCDIKKFYDIIPHPVVRDCFQRVLDRSRLSDEGKAQVMRVLNAYLNSYEFYTNAWLEAQNNPNVYAKLRKKYHEKDKKKKNQYQLGWIDTLLDDPQERQHRGVPQGGSLSLLIANIVLNDVDQVIVQEPDPQRLFIRYCDDMILLHTDYDECCRLMDRYAQSLAAHGLFFHPFKDVNKAIPDKDGKPLNPNKDFWGAKSHHPFLWGDTEEDSNSNRYIGFLGYEIRHDGRVRLRKDNIKRFKEKLNRKFYALRRHMKKNMDKLTEEEMSQHQQEVLDKMLTNLDIYTALDLTTFRQTQGGQYAYLKELTEKTALRLRETQT